MKSTNKKMITLVLSVFMLFGSTLPALAAEIDQETEEAIRTIVENEYYLNLDGVDLEKADLEDILLSLDKYSEYLTREEYENFDRIVEGTFGGLGVSLATTETGNIVNGVLSGTPAEVAGIQVGDMFVSVDGQDVQSLALNELVPLLRGNPGSNVVIEMKREGEDETIIFVMERAIIDMSGKIAELSEDGVAYIKVNTFGVDVGAWFMRMLGEMRESNPGLEGIVLDLRDNTGGRLTSGLSMASTILDKESTLTKIYKQDELIHQYRSTSPGVGVPVVVLGDAGTASASELVIAALVDNEQAKFVGEPTYGKGVMQTIFTLPNNDVLKMTTAEFKGPLDTPIHGVGLSPDYLVEDIPDDENMDEPLIFALELIEKEIDSFVPGEMTFVLNEPKVLLGMNAKTLSAENTLNQGAFVVPLRDTCGLLKLAVRYENEKVVVTGQTEEMIFSPGEREVWVNGVKEELGQPLLMKDGRTYLPARFLGEQLGYQVDYNAETQKVTLSK
ncbi:PDZ domain-containing protein [Clostridia bacterium]|nr:PDZ domain-containing protein [Clostridia bacterium]